MSRTDARTTADGREPCNFQRGPWQPEQGCCILTDMRGRLKIPLGPIKIQREACIVLPQPSNLFLSAQSRWRRWAKLRRVYFGAGNEKQTAAEGRWGKIGKSSVTRKNLCPLVARRRPPPEPRLFVSKGNSRRTQTLFGGDGL